MLRNSLPKLFGSEVHIPVVLGLFQPRKHSCSWPRRIHSVRKRILDLYRFALRSGLSWTEISICIFPINCRLQSANASRDKLTVAPKGRYSQTKNDRMRCVDGLSNINGRCYSLRHRASPRQKLAVIITNTTQQSAQPKCGSAFHIIPQFLAL